MPPRNPRRGRRQPVQSRREVGGVDGVRFAPFDVSAISLPPVGGAIDLGSLVDYSAQGEYKGTGAKTSDDSNVEKPVDF